MKILWDNWNFVDSLLQCCGPDGTLTLFFCFFSAVIQRSCIILPFMLFNLVFIISSMVSFSPQSCQNVRLFINPDTKDLKHLGKDKVLVRCRKKNGFPVIPPNFLGSVGRETSFFRSFFFFQMSLQKFVKNSRFHIVVNTGNNFSPFRKCFLSFKMSFSTFESQLHRTL